MLILICCLSVKISFGAVSLLEAVFRKMLDETVLDTTSEEAVPDTPPPPHLNLLQVAPPLSSSDPDEYFSMFRSELYDADESEAFFKAYKEKHGHGPFHSLLVEQCPTAPVDNLESNNYLESNNSTQSVSCDFSEEEWAQIVEAQGYLQSLEQPTMQASSFQTEEIAPAANLESNNSTQSVSSQPPTAESSPSCNADVDMHQDDDDNVDFGNGIDHSMFEDDETEDDVEEAAEIETSTVEQLVPLSSESVIPLPTSQ